MSIWPDRFLRPEAIPSSRAFESGSRRVGVEEGQVQGGAIFREGLCSIRNFDQTGAFKEG